MWRITQNSNFVKNIDPKTGELIGRRDFSAGKVAEPLCPHISGGVSFNSGSYNPKTGLYYKLGQEWCMTLEVVKTTPVTARRPSSTSAPTSRLLLLRAARSMAISTRATR